MAECQLWLCGHGETKDFTVICIANALKSCKHSYDVMYQSGDALIGRSRSIACTAFLKANQAPYMIFIDTDIIFLPEEVDRLLDSMLAGHDVIGGAYSVASGDRLAIRGWTENIIVDGRIVEVEYISTGFFGISRKALELIRDKCSKTYKDQNGNFVTTQGLPLLHKGDWCEEYPFFESGATNLSLEPFYISEDWDFCNKAREAGLKVYFHTGCLVDHAKQNVIHAETMLAAHSQPNNVQLNPDITLLNDIAEFLKKPFDEVKNSVINYQMKADKTDVDWIYELAQFNGFDYYKGQRLAPLMGIQTQRILDYGCGIGTAAISLCGRNLVTGYDNNKTLIDLCNYRLKKHGFINLNFTDEEPELKDFDIIVFIDVLEHFEDLQTFIKHLGEKVKSGCKIYHFDAFFDKRTPGHFDHSAKINDYWKESGFVVWDNLWAVKI